MGTDGHRSTQPCQVVRRIFGEGFAAGDASVVDELSSPSLVEHQFGLAATGEQAREHVRAAIRDVHGTVPDISFTIEDSAEHGDKIWVRARGIASGPFFGPPSNSRSTSPCSISPASPTARSSNTGECPTASPCSRRPGCLTGWRRVARLAADGRSNREIAGELYVTLKAVEGHLARAYVKLGIQGRDQLPRALGSGKD